MKFHNFLSLKGVSNCNKLQPNFVNVSLKMKWPSWILNLRRMEWFNYIDTNRNSCQNQYQPFIRVSSRLLKSISCLNPQIFYTLYFHLTTIIKYLSSQWLNRLSVIHFKDSKTYIHIYVNMIVWITPSIAGIREQFNGLSETSSYTARL